MIQEAWSPNWLRGSQKKRKKKNWLSAMIHSSQAAQFANIPPAPVRYVLPARGRLRYWLRGGREGVRRFRRFFVCTGVSCDAFEYCFFLAMDGTFTKEIFSPTILLAISVGAGHHAVTSAWALGEGESEPSCRWSLRHRAAIPNLNSWVKATQAWARDEVMGRQRGSWVAFLFLCTHIRAVYHTASLTSIPVSCGGSTNQL